MKEETKKITVQYTDEHGEEIHLTKDDVINYIATDETITEKEVIQFLYMCKYLRLNPFLKEIYLIKYKGSPATFVVSYQTLLKRAEENKNFDGYETEVVGDPPDMIATATVYRKDRTHPVIVRVKYSEVVRMILDEKTKELKPTLMWKNAPYWMLRKVALARALKEAFPTAIGNMDVMETEPADIDSFDKRVIEEKKNYKGSAVEDIYGEAITTPKDLKLTLYEILKEKSIDTLDKVKEILKNVFPDENFTNIDKYVFERMDSDRIQKVIEYLTQTKTK